MPTADKTRLSRGSELRPVYMGTWGRGSQWCNRLLWIIVILRSRFLFWESESEQRREVRTDEKAHYVVDRGAHDGDDDVVLRGGIRRSADNSVEWWRQHAERECERRSYGDHNLR